VENLQDPSRHSLGRKRLVREIATFDDGCCTERASAALLNFLRR
jgi:hypothetical protein